MKHVWIEQEDQLEVDYFWKNGVKWNKFSVTASSKALEILEDSEEEFITEHYWGYTKIGTSKTSEYGVEHPRWETYLIKDYFIDVDFSVNYGNEFAFPNNATPDSVMLV